MISQTNKEIISSIRATSNTEESDKAAPILIRERLPKDFKEESGSGGPTAIYRSPVKLTSGEAVG